MRRFLILLSVLLPMLGMARTWLPDTICPGYEITYIQQPDDYSGPVRSTVVKKPSGCGSDKAVLYVHGYNDYFFQQELGDRLTDSCYHFYAVDLRKYGRSLLPGQNKFEARDLKEYFADIDSALSIIKADGIDDVALMGHSTGGLITSYYMAQKPDTVVKKLLLNSPFLDWNMNATYRKAIIPTVAAAAKLFPRIKISNGHSTAYGESLLKDYHGEWTYDTLWKTLYPQKVTSGWIRAIDKAQGKLQKGADISVPILLMHSDKSVYGDEYTPDFQRGDAVLNVEHISKYGRRLGPDVTEVVIPDGLHDLILSSEEPREKTYDAIFKFLRER